MKETFVVLPKGKKLLEEVSSGNILSLSYPQEEVVLADAIWEITRTPRQHAQYWEEDKPSYQAVVNHLISEGYIALEPDTARELFLGAFPREETYPPSSLLPPEDLVITEKGKILMTAATDLVLTGELSQVVKLLYIYCDEYRRDEIPPYTILRLLKDGYLTEKSDEDIDKTGVDIVKFWKEA